MKEHMFICSYIVALLMLSVTLLSFNETATQEKDESENPCVSSVVDGTELLKPEPIYAKSMAHTKLFYQ